MQSLFIIVLNTKVYIYLIFQFFPFVIKLV
nr:MAG TPA: hypothetical protein [Caudoviricetes sp.]